MSVETVEREIPETSPPVAQKSSFYVAMRILPPPQRDAMYRVYAFCRAVDDIAPTDQVVVAGLQRIRKDKDGKYTDMTWLVRKTPTK